MLSYLIDSAIFFLATGLDHDWDYVSSAWAFPAWIFGWCSQTAAPPRRDDSGVRGVPDGLHRPIGDGPRFGNGRQRANRPAAERRCGRARRRAGPDQRQE